MDTRILAAQLYTVRDFIKTPEDIKETLRRLKEIGYDAVQVSGMGPIDPYHLKDIIDEIGIKIIATHIGYDSLKDDFNTVVKEHKLWGCENIGIGSMPSIFPRNKEGLISFANDASEIGRKLADEGLKFFYHNHRYEFEKFDGVIGMDILINESEPKAFNFVLDTYWIQAGGGNPADWIKKVEGRMDVVHLKDMAIKDDKQIFAEIGEGNLDWNAILSACQEIGVKWYCIEQDICLRDPFESLELSLRNLSKM